MNTNCLQGVMCPQCGYTESFSIMLDCAGVVTDDGLAETTHPTWDNSSRITCEGCEHDGRVGEFRQPAFYVTFETVTEASAETGEHARSGWWEPGGWLLEGADNKPPEPAYLFDPDDVDDDDHEDLGEAIAEWAVALLKREGAMHPNCEPSDDATWWGTEGNEVLEFASGETIRKSFHFHGFNDQLRRRVNTRMAKED